MIKWLTENITKFRPAGVKGDNFHARKRSHGLMGATTHMPINASLGGLGERKFSGYTTKTSLL